MMDQHVIQRGVERASLSLSNGLLLSRMVGGEISYFVSTGDVYLSDHCFFTKLGGLGDGHAAGGYL